MFFPTQKAADRSQRTEDGQLTRNLCAWLAVLLLASGCSKSPTSDHRSPTASNPPTPLDSNTVLRVHWVGKQKIAVAASAYSFARLWNLPASRAMEAQFREQLAVAPWRLITNRPHVTSAPVPEVKAMLYDLVNEETCLEIRRNADEQQAVLAVRLEKTRTSAWSQRLAQVVSSLEGSFPVKRGGGWTLHGQSSGNEIEAKILGSWLVFGVATKANPLMQEITSRIEQTDLPFIVTTNNHWLALDADTRWLSGQLGVSTTTAAMPRLSLQVDGNGAYALTRGELVFPEPLNLKLEPWLLPKDQINGSVVSLTAARGFSEWLNGEQLWRDLKLGPAPNQVFSWAETRAPMQIHLAAPSASASQITRGLVENFAAKANPWLADHALGSIVPWPDANAVVWKDLPMIAPYLTSTNAGWLTGGTSPSPLPAAAVLSVYTRPSTDELLADLTARTNVVAYAWEATGSRAESVHVLGQLARVILRRPQMPANTPTSQWLESVRPRLANTKTIVTLKSPNTLAFERESSTGFTALELHAIADWMESPQFPRGFYTTLSPVGEALKPVGK